LMLITLATGDPLIRIGDSIGIGQTNVSKKSCAV